MKISPKNDSKSKEQRITVQGLKKRSISPELYVQVEESINRRQCRQRTMQIKKTADRASDPLKDCKE